MDSSRSLDDSTNSDTNHSAVTPLSSQHVLSDAARANSQNLTIDKLQVRSLGLYGRQKEVERLKTAYQQLKERSPKARARQLVCISGDSGTGKSALAKQVEGFAAIEGFVAPGKFNNTLTQEPYHAFGQACGELCRLVVTRKNSTEIMNQLQQQLGADASVLTRVIPMLKGIFEFTTGDSNNEPPKNDDTPNNIDGGMMLEARNRFHFAFRRLLRVIANFGPVVVILDDLQWADEASLDLLHVLITDTDNPALMVLCLYRSDEVNEQHAVTKLLQTLQSKSAEDDIVLNQIQVGNLNVQNVNDVIGALLRIDDANKTKSLAEIVHKKTLGNAFHVIQFLLSLQSQRLLTFNLGNFSWQWDDELIDTNTQSTDNVADLMRSKVLTNLDASLTRKLPYVALLGNSFDYSVASLVIGHCDETEATNEITDKEAATNAFLSACIDEGLLEQFGSEKAPPKLYRWVHDKILEAALSLIQDEAVSRLQVGKVLLNNLTPEELEDNLFLTVNLLNDGASLVKGALRLRIAELNLQAGKKAQNSSAFLQGTQYFRKGIELLPKYHWKTHYELSLDLHR